MNPGHDATLCAVRTLTAGVSTTGRQWARTLVLCMIQKLSSYFAGHFVTTHSVGKGVRTLACHLTSPEAGHELPY